MHESVEFAQQARAQGRHVEAIVKLIDANARFPQDADILYNMGILFADMGNHEISLFLLKSAADKRSGWSVPILDMGAIHASLGNWREAVSCCDLALETNPKDPMPLLHSANLLSNMGMHEEAKQRYENAIELDGLNVQLWSDFFLSMNYTDTDASERMRSIQRFRTSFLEVFPEKSMQAKEKDKIRIGYVSSDLRNHAMSYFLKGIVPFHDRNEFDVFFYHNSPINDEITKKISSGGTMVSCHYMTDEELHERIKFDEIDVLIDLNGHTTGNRLKVFMMRSAPVQASWLGFAGTTASPNMDYKIIEAGTATKADPRLYTEKIIPIEGVIAYDPPEYDIEPGELPLKTNGFVTYACFNNPRKINRETLAAWSEVLKRNPNSCIFLLSTGSEEKDQDIKSALCPDEPVRVSFIREMPTKDFIAAMAKADVALDPFPHGGGTTAAHALWMGVPTFTLKGETELQLSSLIMETNGLGHFVSSSVDEYIHKASSVDASVLDRKRRPDSMKGELSARRLEEAYKKLVDNNKRGA